MSITWRECSLVTVFGDAAQPDWTEMLMAPSVGLSLLPPSLGLFILLLLTDIISSTVPNWMS